MSDSLALLQTNQDVHWAFAYLGAPWVRGGEGPGYDCYSFARMVQRLHFGVEMPMIDADADNVRLVATHMQQSPEKANWQRVSIPQEGDCVLMAHAKYPTHIGVYLAADGGGVLHCVRGEGVVFSSCSALMLSGWGRLEYYRHASRT